MFNIIGPAVDKFSNLSTEKQNWIFYGVVLTVLAVPLAVIFDLILGFRIEQIKLNWFPNVLLANFAVAVNLRSLLEDRKTFLPKEKESAYSKFTIVAIILSILCYFFFYSRYETISFPVIIVISILTISSLVAYYRTGLMVIDNATQGKEPAQQDS